METEDGPIFLYKGAPLIGTKIQYGITNAIWYTVTDVADELHLSSERGEELCLSYEKAAKVLKATTDKERRKAEDTRDAAVRLKASGERRRRIDARSDDAEARMADVRRGVDRVKELMERHDNTPSEAERLNSYDDGVRRSQQFADRRAEIDAGVAAARARATSMRDRYSGGRATSSSRDVRGEAPAEDSAGRAAPGPWRGVGGR